MDRLAQVRRQKQQLRQKIMQLQGQKVPQNNLTQQAMAALYQKKQKLEHQRIEQQKYKKLQQQYNERKAQMQRQKQLQRIRNQKRMIQLQVGMKRIVLNGVQQKVKGINSDQLLTRALLSDPNNQGKLGLMVTKQKNQIKRQLQKYLQKQNVKKLKPKHDVYQLNEKRFTLFQKKQELLMRQVLMKQLINSGNHQELQKLNILKCSRQELERLLQEYGIDIDEYVHPLNPKDIIDNYGTIQENIKNNIIGKKRELEDQEEAQRMHEKNIIELNKWVTKHTYQNNVAMAKQLIDQVIYNMIFQYQKRHFQLTKQQKNQKIQQLKKDYQTLQNQNEYYDLAQQFVKGIELQIKNQILKQVVQQMYELWQFAREKTAESIDWIFKKKSYLEYKGSEKDRIGMVRLEFKEQADNIRYDNKKDNKKGIDNLNQKDQKNIFQTQNNTHELINDLKLLSSEQEYFQNITVEIKRQIVDAIDDISDFRLLSQGGLFIIYSKGIKELNEQSDQSRDVVKFQKEIKNILNVKKFCSLWLVQAGDKLEVYSQWNVERIPNAIGERINSPCGHFTNVCIYPTFSLLGSLCSVILSFQKGQVLKYNFNRNRINSKQSNISHYVPLGPCIKTGDQPAFPLNNRNVIEYKNQKVTDSQQIHEFRQFFDYHTHQIINICYYKDNMFITIDKALNCVIWHYQMRRGTKSYEPFYTFSIRSQYKIYKQSQNPRFQDLFPHPNIKQSPAQLYSKWMQQQTFLKLQIYNNPKKSSAYFKFPKWDSTKTEQPIWKINYDQKSKQLLKIFQTYYNVIDGKIQCKEVKIWRQYLIFLVQREHPIRSDLKTIKFYLWSIDEKKLREVAIEFDTFLDQKQVGFTILEMKLQGIGANGNSDYPILLVISSGKILLFSLISGQLLKDVSQQPQCTKIKNFNFIGLQKGLVTQNNIFYGLTRKNIIEFALKNKNNKQKKDEFNRVIEITRKKYNNLI